MSMNRHDVKRLNKQAKRAARKGQGNRALSRADRQHASIAARLNAE